MMSEIGRAGRAATSTRWAARVLGAALLVAPVALFGACADGGGAARTGGAFAAGSGSTGVGAGPSTGTATTAPVLVGVEFASFSNGTGSKQTQRSAELIVDPYRFDQVWFAHTAGQSPAPRYDWYNYAIVAIFQGQSPTPGAWTEVVRVEVDATSGDVYVTVRETWPGTWGRHIAQPVSPFDLVSVPRVVAGAQLHVTYERELAFEVLDQGAQSRIGMGDPTYKGELLVLRDLISFDRFWQRHTRDPLPAVDFSQEMVVAVLAGYRPSFGHRVETHWLVRDPVTNEIRVDYVVHPYRGGAAPPRVTETPFQILRVAKATGAVRQEVRVSLPITQLLVGQQALYQGGQNVFLTRDAQDYSDTLRTQLGMRGPVVDFTKDQVIFAFLGYQRTGGYGISVRSVDLMEDGRLEVLVGTWSPTGNATSVLTSPYQVVRIPRTTGPVSFSYRNVTPVP